MSINSLINNLLNIKIMNSSNGEMDPKLMWSPGMFGTTKMDVFRNIINEKFDLELSSYSDLYQWSVDNYADFWEQFSNFSDIIYTSPYETVVDKSKTIDELPEWFSGAKLNYAQNVLEKPENSDPNKAAVFVISESQTHIERVTFGDLKSRVTSLVSAMRKYGISAGDRVVGYLPNGREAIEAFLATSAIGAIWSSTSPDFGISGVLERLRQIKPKILFSVDSVVYNGKRHNHLDKLSQLMSSLDSIERVIISPLKTPDDNNNNNQLNDFMKTIKCQTYDQFLAEGDHQKSITYFDAPFNHPLCILFSSGTTGEPKCLVHSVGGTLIQHLKEHILHGNVGSNDTMLFYTTTGWMMWNWMVSALAAGSALVVYDGSPFKPTSTSLWDVIDKIGVTILGASPKGLQTMQELGLKPRESHHLERLHTILSTGAPLNDKLFEYVYTSIKTDILLGSISGGSDIISCFAGQNPTIGVHSGEIQARNLGMAVECWDHNGTNVINQKGELVCVKPFPSMPTMLWNDPKGNKYRNAYFSQFKGVWTHGDFCLINGNTNGIQMLGRSDGTLNPNGIRFGSSEIYNIIDTIDEIDDSVCVSQYNDKNEERVVLFVKMKADFDFNKTIVDKIRTEIRNRLSPRHIPAVILQVTDIPYTINGKKIEVAIKRIIAGKEVTNRNAIANPESLEYFNNCIEISKL
ncbi:acetoacetyl-CoA synthetase-like [Oppia nitens]|uniref:acetoacetyl-CoA synthetase-like n=1 Tax=Oppia nitens TaxID=1686743 RepID=UPI0023DB0FAE|nr:acetoacetyl-CoA synthetase-like [Oppia nitens]